MDENFKIEIYEEYPDHHFRTEIPNIIFRAGLDSYDYSVYSILKNIAGDKGSCYASVKTMCVTFGISERKFRECILNLSRVNKKLGKPLITITERKKKDGSSDTNLIKIVPLWRDNGDFFRNEKKSMSCSEVGGVLHSVQGGPALSADKEEHLKKNKEETHNTNLAREKPKASKEKSCQTSNHAGVFSSFFKEEERKAIQNKGFKLERIDAVISYAQNSEFWKSRLRKSGDILRNFETLNAQCPPSFDDASEVDKCKMTVLDLKSDYPLSDLQIVGQAVYDKSYMRTYCFSLGYKELKRRILETWGLS